MLLLVKNSIEKIDIILFECCCSLLGYNCGYPINPARDLAPRLFTLCVGYGKEVFSIGNYYFWIPCIGPIFGGIIGTWIYYGYSRLMKIHMRNDEHEIIQERY